MPYIKREDRARMIDTEELPSNAGEFNFLVTTVADACLQAWGLNYGNINALIGALECAKLELYRRVAAPYEDTKIKINGDVYAEENLSRGADVQYPAV